MPSRNQRTVLRGKLIEKIDAYARAVSRGTGVEVSREQAACALVRLGLSVAKDAKR